ncbi:hypothetical protein ACFFHH_12485 [Cytobacillus solani]|uniref:Uncharacterized protein n=1 Tax=Cytobacillus solani TaxID=1637975 RepID=A0A0Q3QL84_9BACI|nr:hypothetical protein [Cytobacillus solani]KOP81510.1 hypothetical protein AMS60_02845 [Bacillus sp. FJAT-21945]KQL18446.1 hypothetical protein AN957_07595 [Cytobacillus solani]USK56306.1 hypothetical protein LIS82_07475 [Cytobacillus solani]
MLKRKIISASISGTLFAILLGFVMPNPFREQVVAEQNYFYSATNIISLYLMYSLPVILIYGVLASIISDKVAEFMSKKSEIKNIEIIVSGVLHIVFGLVLLPYSLGASVLFFVTDRILQKQNKNFYWLQVIKSFVIPLTVWIISLSISWIEHFINNS